MALNWDMGMKDPHPHVDAAHIDIRQRHEMVEVWLETGDIGHHTAGILIGASPSRLVAIDEAVIELQRRISDLKREISGRAQLVPRI